MLACGPSEEDKQIETVYAELMEGHDVVMPKSMQLPKLKSEVLKAVNELPEGDSLKTAAIDLGKELITANEDMYTWMDEFAVAMNDVEDKTEKLKLYESLNTEIKEIGEATNAAIETANKFLKEHE
ncbi:hypothetical protein DJ013_03480 [Arcticibacterium luteifluviistationis]|uniref:Uncharacterized protein n=1 Tax=Arcticibacterium luteifluviistationis TaxID=1784714 RepID=A0A2Z4G7W6_9BACT|nr:hypothetical protein DJ013_03480 [Arcticibacterium luteifluviistationis]